MPNDTKERHRVVLFLADGQLPPEVDPESKQGKHYRYLINAVKSDVATLAPLTAQQKQVIVTLLRGGGGDAAA